MAAKRMFSTRLIQSGKFMKMPHTSQLLYFYLGMYADDDGVVEAYSIMKMNDFKTDDLKVLDAKNYITVLDPEDDIVFINNWHENNYIRADRKTDSIHKSLLLRVIPDVELIHPKERADRKKKDGTSQGQPGDGIGKDRLGKDRVGKVYIGSKAQIKSLVHSKNWEYYRISIVTIEKYIEKIRSYSASSGKKYRDEIAAIRDWVTRDIEAGKLEKYKVAFPEQWQDFLRTEPEKAK